MEFLPPLKQSKKYANQSVSEIQKQEIQNQTNEFKNNQAKSKERRDLEGGS
jgi:hypothetical protein